MQSLEKEKDRSSLLKMVSRLSRKQEDGMTTKRLHSQCVQRKMLRTIDISQSQTFQESTFQMNGSRELRQESLNSRQLNRRDMLQNTEFLNMMLISLQVLRRWLLSSRKQQLSAMSLRRLLTGLWLIL